MRGFINSYPKAQNIENQNKFLLRKLVKKKQADIDQFIEKISNDKGIHQNHF